MAHSVTNLTLGLQSGTTNTLYASWSFTESTTTTTNTSVIKKGTVVKLKSGAKYYNGATIPSWVFNKNWIVLQVDGDRVVIDKSSDGENSICSAVNAKDLTVVSGGGSSSSSTTTTTNNLDHFEVTWKYTTGDKYSNGSAVYFEGTTANVNVKNHTWSFPSNAVIVKVSVKPVSKTYEKDGNTKSYWTGTEVCKEYTVVNGKPEDVSPPSITIDKYRATISLEGITDGKAEQIEFYVIKGDEGHANGIGSVKAQKASIQCDVVAGYKYRAKCRAINVITEDKKYYGEWSSYCAEVSTIPASVTDVMISVDSETSVKLTWKSCATATGYTVEYTTKKSYFDTSTETSSITVDSTTAYITGLDSGSEWFFRVKASNPQGDSGWSEIVSTVIGTTPEAPTTWSSTTTAQVGENVTLYWVHNTEDGSKQRGAEILLVVDGVEQDPISVTTSIPDDEDEPTYSYKLDTSKYSEGAEIKWSVRTKGVTGEYGEYSIQRTITLYAPPTLSVSADTTITSLPYNIQMSAGPSSQTVLSYHISLVAKSSYEISDVTGTPIYVTSGEEVYSKVFIDSTNPLSISISAGDVILKNDQTYTLTITVAMSSGLTSEVVRTVNVNWSDDETYSPDASLSIDRDRLCAYISPFCIDKSNYITNDVTLSVYRREPDGALKEIATDLVNDGVITVTDPHPSLDYARYRIVAINKSTGAAYYTDLPGEPIREPSIIIQWNEQWSTYTHEEVAETETPPIVGSILKLPYNVDISESRSIDVSLIEYIGRKHPVSYYGTQRGETATWSAEIPKTDKETIYGLRRLANWNGDAYVREPSGTGYWANVKVSFTITHLEVVIPVILDITRVEGGI